MPNPPARPESASTNPASNSPETRTITSEELLRGNRQIFIQHAGELYRLQLTRNGKLILQK